MLLALYPLAQDYLRAASLLQRIADPHATGWIANYDVHPVDVRDTSFDFKGTAIPARIYLPRGVGFAPGIVVVHGMHELGINEPRLVSFARSLAASGFFVMTPQVPGIADYRVRSRVGRPDRHGSAELRAATPSAEGGRAGAQLLRRTGAAGGQRSAVFAIDRLGRDGWRALRSGARAALLRHRRGGSPGRNGRALPPHEYGPLIVVYDEPQDFFAPQDAQAAHEAIKLLLSGDGKASEELTKTLTPAGQEIMQRIYHKQREQLRAGDSGRNRQASANSWPPLLPPVISRLFTCRFCCCTAPTTR